MTVINLKSNPIWSFGMDRSGIFSPRGFHEEVGCAPLVGDRIGNAFPAGFALARTCAEKIYKIFIRAA